MRPSFFQATSWSIHTAPIQISPRFSASSVPALPLVMSACLLKSRSAVIASRIAPSLPLSNGPWVSSL